MDKIIDDNNKIVGNINLDNSNIKFIGKNNILYEIMGLLWLILVLNLEGIILWYIYVRLMINLLLM